MNKLLATLVAKLVASSAFAAGATKAVAVALGKDAEAAPQ